MSINGTKDLKRAATLTVGWAIAYVAQLTYLLVTEPPSRPAGYGVLAFHTLCVVGIVAVALDVVRGKRPATLLFWLLSFVAMLALVGLAACAFGGKLLLAMTFALQLMFAAGAMALLRRVD